MPQSPQNKLVERISIFQQQFTPQFKHEMKGGERSPEADDQAQARQATAMTTPSLSLNLA